MKFLAFILTSLLAFSAKAQLFVGNGGEGYQVGDRIELRDLVEAGLEEQDLFWGPVEAPAWRSLVAGDALVQRLGLDAELLARKLADFETLQDGLSGVIWLAIHGHDWRLSEMSLPMLASPRLARPLYQVAIRTGRGILLNREGWSAMSKPQRTALVLHEALSSLSRVFQEADGSGFLTQDHQGARDLLAESFRARLPHQARSLRTRIQAQLEIGELVAQCRTAPLYRACSVFDLDPRAKRIILHSIPYETAWGRQQGFAAGFASVREGSLL